MSEPQTALSAGATASTAAREPAHPITDRVREALAVSLRGCEELLPNILRNQPRYLTLSVSSVDGTLFCSASPRDRRAQLDARTRAWFERVMQSRTTAAGDYQISANTGQPAIVIAHPLLDALGDDPADVDTLCARTAQPAAAVLEALVLLELDGRVVALPGARWQQRRQA